MREAYIAKHEFAPYMAFLTLLCRSGGVTNS